MKKMGLFAVLFTFLALSLYNLPAVSNTPKETRVTGTLHVGSIPVIQPNETGYWLKSDELIYVHKGSKSEASTDVVKLRVPADLQEKARKLDGQHVVVVGLMNCTGNWAVGAHCDMLVKQIEQNNFKDILGTWDRFDPETGEKFDNVVIASRGNVLEVTVFAGFSGWVTIPAQFDGRKLKYKYVHTSPSCDVAYEVDVSLVANGLMQGYLNSKVLRTNPGFPVKVGRKASVPTELRKR